MAAVKFEGYDRRWTMVYEVDELELIERYGHGVKFLGRRPNT
jgi:UDP-N-acetylmuramate-alanine ligase